MTTISPRTATVTIYQGDDLERLAELRRVAEVAERQEQTVAARIGDLGDAQAARDAYDAFVDEAAERAVVVRVTQLGRKAFRALLTEHPPRDGNDDDKAEGFNVDTFPEALLLESVTEPQMSRAALSQFLDALADGDFETLWYTTYEMNRSVAADPFASRYSARTPSTDATSS